MSDKFELPADHVCGACGNLCWNNDDQDMCGKCGADYWIDATDFSNPDLIGYIGKANVSRNYLMDKLRLPICITCAEDKNCPMVDMLAEWREIKDSGEVITEDTYKDSHIEEPDCDGDVITWCPMFYTVEGLP